MDEFISQNYSLITHSVEFLAAITGLLLYKRYKFAAAKYFIWFLLYLSICDLLNKYVGYVKTERFLSFLLGTVFEKNHWWSTSYWKVGAILFFVFYYNRILKNTNFKTIIKYSGFGFFLFSVIFIALNWNDFFINFFPSISVIGAFIIFLCTIFYFIEILQSERILTFYRSLNFYISITIFIWWLIITPIVFYDIYYVYDLETSFRDRNYVLLRRQIYLSANVFMYLTFTFALIWCNPEND